MRFFVFSFSRKNHFFFGEMKRKREKTTKREQLVFLRVRCFRAERDEERRKRDFKKRRMRRRRSTATIILHAGRREISHLLNVVYVKLQIDGEIFAQLLGELVRDAAAIFTAAHGVA